MCIRDRHLPTYEGPQFGSKYASANGTEMENEGEKWLTMVTKDGVWDKWKMQVANVTRALASVSEQCAAGKRVVFNPPWHNDGCYVTTLDDQGRPTEETSWMTLRNGVYELETKIAPMRWQVKPPGFKGQGSR